MGFQASIASANVGDKAYSPLWRIQATTWKDPSRPDFLTSLARITSAAQAGKLSTNIAGVVVNCPFVFPQLTALEGRHLLTYLLNVLTNQ